MSSDGATGSSPSTSPSPAGWSTIPRRSSGSRSRRCARPCSRRENGRPASASPTSARPPFSGTGRRWSRLRRRSCGRIGGPPIAAGSCGSRASRPCCRGGPGSSPIPISRPPSWNGCSATTGFAARAPTGRARGRYGRELARREAHRWPGARHRPHQRLTHAAVRSRARATGSPSCSARSGFRENCSGRSSPHPASWARPTGCISTSRCRSRGWPVTSSRRSSARDAAPAAWRRTPMGPARFCWCTPATVCPSRPRGVLATAACGPAGEPAYALEGSVFIAGAAVQWLRDGLGIIAGGGGNRGAGPGCIRHRRRALRAGVRWTGDAALGAGGARHDHRDHPRHHAGPPGAGRAGGDGVQQRRLARRDDRLRATCDARRSGWTGVRRPTTG